MLISRNVIPMLQFNKGLIEYWDDVSTTLDINVSTSSKYLLKIAFKLNNTSLNYFLWINRVVNNANKAFFIIYGWICKYYRCNLFKTYKKCYYYVACLPAHRHKFSSVSRQFIEVELHFIPKWSLLKIGQFIKLDNK